jgi:alpha-L-fucosidase
MKLINIKLFTVVSLLLMGYFNATAQNYPRKTDDKLRAEQIRGMKFGMFICWSFSTFSGKEWTPTEGKE